MLRCSLWLLANLFSKSLSQSFDACTMSGTTDTCATSLPERFEKVEGSTGKFNDVVLNYSVKMGDAKKVVVFFGGDIQDFPEAMMKHRDNRLYVQWNLENMATLMGKHFPNAHCIIIRPNRLQYLTFSCYDNFVESNDMGAPTHEFSISALEHMHALLSTLSTRLNDKTDKAKYGPVATTLLEHPVTLIGFSKGCVVLNQFLYAMKALEVAPDDDVGQLVRRIKAMYWLDGGHSGGSNTWVTKEAAMKPLKHLDIKVYIHVTPYQVLCSSRPWIGKEEKVFRETLKKLGVDVTRKIYHEDEPSSLEMHFAVLEEFKEVA
ncbi:mitochondrial protein C2orf69 [Rhipicephalus microplus]|uniref:mitochondrial protein C2orf69 n=1 Tax=Rhipicephalus microplus TaxID=6941 RepID=UPI003F6D8C91